MSKTAALHTSFHISPAQAAHIAGVSRWTIMRAINNHELKANRDNRNHWRIVSDDLELWVSSTVRTVEAAHHLHTPTDSPETLAKLAGETARANAAERARDQAEADRDAWREMAQKRRSWWPW